MVDSGSVLCRLVVLFEEYGGEHADGGHGTFHNVKDLQTAIDAWNERAQPVTGPRAPMTSSPTPNPHPPETDLQPATLAAGRRPLRPCVRSCRAEG